MKTLIVNINGITGRDGAGIYQQHVAIEQALLRFPEIVIPEDDSVTVSLSTILYNGPGRAINAINDEKPDLVIIPWNDTPRDIHQQYADVITDYAYSKDVKVLTIRKEPETGIHHLQYIRKDENGHRIVGSTLLALPNMRVISKISVSALASIRTVHLLEHIPMSMSPNGREGEMFFLEDIDLKGSQWTSMYGGNGTFTESDRMRISGRYNSETGDLVFDKTKSETRGFEIFSEK